MSTSKQYGRHLWPDEEYRNPDQHASNQIIRKLYPSDEYRSGDQREEQQMPRRLWPSDEYRLPAQTEEAQVIRQLWQWQGETPALDSRSLGHSKFGASQPYDQVEG